MSLSANYPALAPNLILDFANSNRVDPRITVTRASTATFYDGVTFAKAEENLFPWSQQFEQNTVWAPNAATISADVTTAPDGTTTADRITANAGTGTVPRVANTNITLVSSVLYTVSIFAKADTYTFLQIYINSQGTEWVNYTLSGAGTATANGSCTATITSLANSWYRLTMTYTPGATDRRPLFMLAASGTATRAETWNPAGTEAMFLWGAQLEQRSAATAYTVTTTQPITNYIQALQTAQNNVPRIDHSPTTTATLGLLVEEQRTNLAARSEEFDNAYWAKTNSTVTANSNVGPGGTLSADTLVEDTATGIHALTSSSITYAATTAYAFSVYAKPAGRSWLLLQLSTTAFGTTTRAWFNIGAGTVGIQTNSTGTITSVGNGWYRCTIVATTTVGGSLPAAIYLATGDGLSSYTGDGFSGVFIWGAQLEAGAFPTSYIATGAATATRQADVIEMTGANFTSWYNSTTGTICDEVAFTASNVVANARSWSLGTGAGGNPNLIVKTSPYSGSSRIRTLGYDGSGALQFDFYPATTFTTNTFNRSATALQASNFAQSINGATPTTSASGTMAAPTLLAIGASPTGGQYQNGWIKKISYYPVRNTNAQLQALTGT